MSVDIIATPRSTAWLARANPLAKLGAGMAITLVLLVSVDWASATMALVLECLLLPLAGLSARMLLLRGWPILFAAVVGGYGTALLAPKTGEVLLALGPVTFTSGSVEAGVAIALRGLAIALPGIIVLASTDPTDLADALAQKLRLPHRFVLGALAAMRLVGLLVAEWQTLGMARRARGVGGEPGLFRGAKAQRGPSHGAAGPGRAPGLAPGRHHGGQGLRCGGRTWARESTFARHDLWVAVAGLVIAAVSVAAAVALGTWNPVFG